MNHKTLVLLIVVLSTLSSLVSGAPGYAQSNAPAGIDRLQAAADGPVEVTQNPFTGRPSFIRGPIPLEVVAQAAGAADKSQAVVAFVDRYADVFGITDAAVELVVQAEEVDDLGMTHVTLGQVYRGVEVYNASMKVHLATDGRSVAAIGNGFVPGIRLVDVRPAVISQQALEATRKALPGGQLMAQPRLVVYPGRGEAPGTAARLVPCQGSIDG